MSDINWVSTLPAPTSVVFGLRSNTLAFSSPLTGAVQTVSMPGARWFATMTWESVVRAQADALQALMVRLRGRSNRLVLWNLARPNIKGVGGGAPLVNGVGQVGASINIDGLPASTSNIYVAGDFIGIGGQLVMVTANVNSNALGQATVSFEAPLRASPSDNSAIVTSQPTGKFMLVDDDVAWKHVRPMTVDSMEMQLVEVFQ